MMVVLLLYGMTYTDVAAKGGGKKEKPLEKYQPTGALRGYLPLRGERKSRRLWSAGGGFPPLGNYADLSCFPKEIVLE
jgi:hypothetical protein